jgi:hypothetical protein
MALSPFTDHFCLFNKHCKPERLPSVGEIRA